MAAGIARLVWNGGADDGADDSVVLLEEGSVALHLGSIFVNGVKRRKLELRSPPERRGPSEVRLLFKGEEHLDVAFQDRAEADGFFCACRALREKGALALPRGPATPLAAQRPAKRARLDVEAAHALALRGLRRESAQLEILRQNMEGRLAAGEAEGEALRQRAERLEQARKAADAARRASEAALVAARQEALELRSAAEAAYAAAEAAARSPAAAEEPPGPCAGGWTAALKQMGEAGALSGATPSELAALGEALLEGVRRVQQEQHSRVKQQASEQLCAVCLTERKDVVLQPCHHLVMCAGCAGRCDEKCPQCRAAITGHFRVFL